MQVRERKESDVPASAARRLRSTWPEMHKLNHSDPPTREPKPALEGLAVRARFKRLTSLGWPRSFPIVQFPNAPLIVAFVAGMVAANAHGSAHFDASAVSYLALAVWAYEELTDGVNWFRHLLGLAYAVSTITHLAGALHH